MTFAMFMIVVCAFAAGGTMGTVVGLVLAKDKIDDYRKRWETATNLLKQIEDGQDPVKVLAAAKAKSAEVQRVTTKTKTQVSKPPNWPSQRELNSMWSEDRKKLEIERAEAGLPPADNLNGMWSEDKKKVLRARMKHGTAS